MNQNLESVVDRKLTNLVRVVAETDKSTRNWFKKEMENRQEIQLKIEANQFEHIREMEKRMDRMEDMMRLVWDYFGAEVPHDFVPDK